MLRVHRKQSQQTLNGPLKSYQGRTAFGEVGPQALWREELGVVSDAELFSGLRRPV